jgi:predicted MarR family transcription regulator
MHDENAEKIARKCMPCQLTRNAFMPWCIRTFRKSFREPHSFHTVSSSAAIKLAQREKRFDDIIMIQEQSQTELAKFRTQGLLQMLPTVSNLLDSLH